MNANTTITLEQLHAAIIADIQAKFPTFRTVEFYRGEGNDFDDRKTLPVPACLLNLSELEASEDDEPLTEQLAVIAHFEAEILVKSTTQGAKMAVRSLAATMAAWLHNRRWNNPAATTPKLPTGPCVVIGAYQDDFSSMMPGKRDAPLDQFEIWKVEWRQKLHLGESVWTDDGSTPTPGHVYLRENVNGEPSTGYVEIQP